MKFIVIEMSENTQVTKIPENCKVCNSDNKFVIQKAIDNKAAFVMIAREFGVTVKNIKEHIEGEHRESLLELGMIDYVMRKKGVDVGLTLSNLIEKWSSGIEVRTPETIRDNDAIRAMELLLKSQGDITNKHEIIVKRSIEDALQDFLGDDEETEEVK
jgi:predicted transcriptional regulator